MRVSSILIGVGLRASLALSADGAEKTNYPQPRFPSYLKPPKLIEGIMPFALAARYGEPNDVLGDNSAAHIPGISAPGRYEDYAKDPWKTATAVMKKIDDGSYEYFYPQVKAKK